MAHSLPLLLAPLLVCAGTLPSAAAPAGFSGQESQASDEAGVRLLLEGSVLDPDGAPAVGAVVVSSAGGRASVDPQGRYRLELRVPLAVREIQVTAVGAQGGNSLASARVVLEAPFENVRVGPLWLTEGSACAPGWLPTFGQAPGVFGPVHALAAFDDGSGPALYAAGKVTGAGAVVASRIVKWDGEEWAAVGTGPESNTIWTVFCLAVFDDGTGPALYAGGDFPSIGGVTARFIAKWNGTSWSSVGPAMGTDLTVRALTVFDDGSGPALYAGGAFQQIGGVSASRVAKWDGSSWTGLGSGVNSTVYALAADEGGGVLYAAGDFWVAGGGPANRVAAWDGTSWFPLGSATDGSVRALALLDDGNGPDLYAAGLITFAGGVPVNNIARWDGSTSTWSSLGSGVDAVVNALAVFDDGGGPALHVAGDFTTAGGSPARGIARWDGTSWSAFGTGMDTPVNALAMVDLGTGPLLYAGGDSTDAGGAPLRNVARWDGASWSALGRGLDQGVSSFLVHDDGSGPVLYAGGRFTTLDGVSAKHIAKWDGTSWSPLGSGTEHPPTAVYGVRAMTMYDDGNGPALYAGGEFTSAGGVPANRIARWDGTSWSPLGSGFIHWASGFQASIQALAVFDEGSGPVLFAGGEFGTAGGVAASPVARWNGSTWSAVGGSVNPAGVVFAMVVFDDGSGEALYVAGGFRNFGGVTLNSIAKWDGTSWSPLGNGIDSGMAVRALAVWDDGGGPALYAAGNFSMLGIPGTNSIAKWDGTSWSALGTGVFNFAYALAAFDDSSGPALFVGGTMITAGGLPVNRIAKWDGSSWSSPGSGVVSALGANVLALAVMNDGRGPALFAGGDYTSLPDSHDSFLSRWGCPDTTVPVIDCPTSLVVLDRIELPKGGGGMPGEFVTFTVTATDDADPAPLVTCEPPSGSFFPRGTTLVTCTATDASGNEATCVFPLAVSEHVPVPPLVPQEKP